MTPVVTEADDLANDRPATAQNLTLPAVVAGRIGKLEDVDWYAFEAEKGERITFEVWGNRLENKIHDLQTHLDPILSLHDQTGRELAAADNTHFADPLLSYQVPASGNLLPSGSRHDLHRQPGLDVRASRCDRTGRDTRSFRWRSTRGRPRIWRWAGRARTGPARSSLPCPKT